LISLNSVRQKSSNTVIVHGLLLPHLCVIKTSKYFFIPIAIGTKTKQNEKANSNRNTDRKWRWLQDELINGISIIS